MGIYSIKHLSTQSVEALFFYYFCVKTGVYDTMSATEFMVFFKSKVIDYFNILKINVKFEHQFTASFKKYIYKLPLCTLS